jgi:predicted RNA-binding Zn-ribbon protein involved in translation (DUF1610 family)
VRPNIRQRAGPGPAGKVSAVTTDQPTRQATETAAAAAAFLASQEITAMGCPQCGSEVSGLKGRYACGVCGWANPWYEGHGELPTAEDDQDWPGHAKAKKTA